MSHKYNHRSFMVFNVSELGSINFSEVLETSDNTIRKSLDEIKTFVKWDVGTTPPSVNSLTTKEGPYTYGEMMSILGGAEWSPEEI